MRDVLVALDLFSVFLWVVLWCGLGGRETGDELESLILAQNERWRHA
jgi:hypothetical protein